MVHAVLAYIGIEKKWTIRFSSSVKCNLLKRRAIMSTSIRNLTRRFSKPKLRKLKKIAIDEISIGKGHDYLTVVLDLETGAVVFVSEGKGAEGLKPFRKKVPVHGHVSRPWPQTCPRHTSVPSTRI
jgi:transposase